MIWLVSALVAAVVLGGTRAALRPRGVEVDHIVLFSFGLGFYWVLPIVAGMIRVFADEPGLALWYATWDAAAGNGALTWFAAFALVTYGAFLAGDRVGARLGAATAEERPELPRDPRLLGLFLPPALGLTLVYAWGLRGELFAGYRFVTSPSVGAARGTLSACSLLLLVLCFLWSADGRRTTATPTGWRHTLTNPFLLAYLVSAVLVLSLGGRLYVVSAAIMALVYHSVYGRPIPLARAAMFVVLAIVVSGVIGSIRLGNAPSLLGIAFNVLAEPLFTGFSLLHFLGQNDIPWIAAPRFLLGDFLNLVPSALFPNKGQYRLNPSDFGYSIFSPLGALNSFVSFTINFGLIGTVLVIFVLGAALAVLKRRRGPLARVIYTMLSGWLPFTFFRDAFSISVVKNMVEFSVLMPMLLVASIHVMTIIAPRRPRVRAADAAS